MRFPWTKKDEVFIEEEKPKKKETFSSVSDKILIKRMKKDNTFGIEMAMRYKGLDKEKPESFKEKLKEEVELKKLMKEYFGKEGGGGEGSWLSKLLDKETFSLILAIAASQLGIDVSKLQQGQGEAVGQIEQPKQPQLSAPKAKPKLKKLSINDLIPYLDYEPEEVIKELADKASAGEQQAMLWLYHLKGQTYEGLVTELSIFTQYPEYSVIANQLLSEERKPWLEKLLELTKNIKIEEK